MTAKTSFLLESYPTVDAIVCFLDQKHLACTPERVAEMVQGSRPGFRIYHLHDMARVAPELISLSIRTETGDDAHSLELVSLSPSGSSITAKKKRLFSFQQACNKSMEGTGSVIATCTTSSINGLLGERGGIEAINTPVAGGRKRKARFAPATLDGSAVHATGALDSLSDADTSCGLAHASTPARVGDASLTDHHPVLDALPLDPLTWDSIEAFLAALPFYSGQIVSSTSVAARAPHHALLKQAACVPAPVWTALSAHGIGSLFTHQAMAIDAALSGSDVVISTSTSRCVGCLNGLSPSLRTPLPSAQWQVCSLLRPGFLCVAS